jgi:hypothetical protein
MPSGARKSCTCICTSPTACLISFALERRCCQGRTPVYHTNQRTSSPAEQNARKAQVAHRTSPGTYLPRAQRFRQADIEPIHRPCHRKQPPASLFILSNDNEVLRTRIMIPQIRKSSFRPPATHPAKIPRVWLFSAYSFSGNNRKSPHNKHLLCSRCQCFVFVNKTETIDTPWAGDLDAEASRAVSAHAGGYIL